MKLLVINGPNINMLGIREPDIYGSQSYSDLLEFIVKHCAKHKVEVEIYQSNHEGEIVDKIQSAYNKIDAIVINPAAYTHTSVAILDAIKSVNIPTVEVHLSKVSERDSFRQISYIREACETSFEGEGFNSYLKAIDYLIEKYNN